MELSELVAAPRDEHNIMFFVKKTEGSKNDVVGKGRVLVAFPALNWYRH